MEMDSKATSKITSEAPMGMALCQYSGKGSLNPAPSV